jgi:hypothetical protein
MLSLNKIVVTALFSQRTALYDIVKRFLIHFLFWRYKVMKNDTKTSNLILKYLLQMESRDTVKSKVNEYYVLTRKDTPLLELTKKICTILRKENDEMAIQLCKGFIASRESGRFLVLSSRLPDDENIEIFKMYYLDKVSKNEIMEKFDLNDERTFYKKLNSAKSLFAISIYDFLMFISQ